MKRFLTIALLFFGCALYAQETVPFAVPEEVVVDLRNPTFKDGILSTEEGGVIVADGMRIQARKITYVRKGGDTPISTVVAEGDLMFEQGDQVFTGSRLEYNFLEKRGLLLCGRSMIGPWYFGGQSIELCPNGSYILRDAYITTCEDADSEWQLKANRVRISKSGWVSAEIVKIRFLNLPVFYLPRYTTHLKSLFDAPISYRADFAGPQGPRLGMRYRVYQRGAFKAYLRGEYLTQQGPAAALETEWDPPNREHCMRTQSYVARGDTNADPTKRFRYRFAGRYDGLPLPDPATHIRAQYDFLSDLEMPSDYYLDDFDLHTAHQTLIEAIRPSHDHILTLYTRVRVNDFQTIGQELPTLSASFRPRSVGLTGIITQDYVSAGYRDYVFAKQTPFEGFHASRISFRHDMYRPLNLHFLTLTPRLVADGIYYSNGQSSTPEGLITAAASIEAKSRLSRRFGCYKHILEPYARYLYGINPTSTNNEHYIFSIDDAYTRLNYVRFGLRNLIFQRGQTCQPPCRRLELDLFAYGFVSTPAIQGSIPRLYAHLDTSPTSWLTAHVETAYNFSHHQLDHFYGRLQFTASEDAAFSLELRYRGYYDWLKADPWNFVLDSFTDESILRTTGISNRRFILLTHSFVRFTPSISAELQTRNGWKNSLNPAYLEFKASLYFLLPCRFRLSVYYERLLTPDRYGFTLTLGPGRCRRPVGHTPTVW